MARKITFGLCCLALCAACFNPVAFAKSTEIFHATYQVEPGKKLELHNADGNVTIRQWNKDYVDVSAQKKALLGGRLDHVKIDVINEGGGFYIKTENLVRHPRVNVTYNVHIPAGMIVHYVKTSDGDVRLEGTQGSTIVKTSDGNITVRDIHGHFEADTSDGSILIKGVKGNVSVRSSDADIAVRSVTGLVEARTSDGDVLVNDVTGNVKVRTSDGEIKIKNVGGIVEARTSDKDIMIKEVTSLVRAETSDGDIIVQIPPTQALDASIATNDGSIKLFISPDLNLDLDLKTSDGKISLHEIEINVNKITRNRIKGRLGHGGKKLSVRTSDGHIDLFPLK